MSFTIKCDKCGNEATFNNGDSKQHDKIEIIPDIRTDGFQLGFTINSVDIYCENNECNNDVELK